ncbi:MAG TPA: hypothetical protein DGG95_05320 [Cytophagales bacterium]|jgi:hypothetical protein|nr:hypothetical protein [Cytophagales bacterium]
MKSIFFLFLVVLFSVSQLNAQQDQLKYEKYRRMKGTGTALTVLGGIATIVGVSMMTSVEYTTTTNQYGQQQTTPNDSGTAVGGALLFLGGTGMLGAGIPLMIVGSKKAKKYKVYSSSLNLDLAPMRAGLSFRF